MARCLSRRGRKSRESTAVGGDKFGGGSPSAAKMQPESRTAIEMQLAWSSQAETSSHKQKQAARPREEEKKDKRKCDEESWG